MGNRSRAARTAWLITVIAALLAIVGYVSGAVGAVAGFAVGLVGAGPDPCPSPAGVIWDNGNQGHNAYGSDSLTVHLEQCTTLVVTSGHLVGPDKNECGYQGDQLCVVTFRATHAQDVSITALDAGHTWYGITGSSSGTALGDKRGQFFAPPNCNGGGCAFATVFAYADGVASTPEVLRP